MFKERKETQRVDAEPLAIFSLVSVVLGLGLSFLKGRWSSIAPALMGFTGLAFLLMLKSKIDNEVLREGGGVVQVEYGIGFWLSSMLLLFAAVWNAFLSQREKAS